MGAVVLKDNLIMLARAGLWVGCSWLAGCSFLIDVNRDQCSTDGDCERAGVAGSCEQGICVMQSDSPATCDGGECSSVSDAGDAGDGGDGDGGDAGMDPSGVLCSDVRCEEGELCFAETCVSEATIAPFICEPEEPAAPVGPVSFRMPVRDFVTGEPLPDLVVLACREADVSCDSPIARFDDPEGTGDIELELPYEFQGYLEVSSPAVLTSLWYFTKPLLEPLEAKVLKAVAPSTVEVLASITGIDVDSNSKGIVILEAFDCERNAAGGIHFEEEKRTALPFYIIDERPNREATVSVRNEVENQAAGGFVNATPGFTQFFARIGVDGPILGGVNANVKANTVTYVDIHP
jgi:hypothetical protein